MSEFQYDLVIIGAGPGGYEAAYEAADFGMKVALVEKDLVGGTCLNRGCVPTKTMMHSSDAYRIATRSANIGVSAEGVKADLNRIIDRKCQVSETLRDGIMFLLKKKKVDFVAGTAKVTDGHTVEISGNDEVSELTAANIMIATGSEPATPPIPGADLPGVLDSTGLLDLRGEIMKDFVIIGGGVIGIEFATIYSDLGTNVTVVEAMDRLLPNMDKELGRSLKMNFKNRGIDTHTNAMVEKIEERNGRLVCFYKEKDKVREVEADHILVCTGRRPVTKGVFSEELEEKLLGARGFLQVDDCYRTEIPSIYGSGDAIGGTMLAHTATAEGRNAVAIMNGKEPEINMNVVAGCIYTSPEIASVGLTQDEAKEEGIDVITKKFPTSANGKTIIEELDRGFIKLVASKEDHTLLGAQLMCGRATDIIGELAVAIANGLTIEEVANTIHPHPTFVEAVCEAARA
ncbi:MAG: dihydrolipoyl dehydrogenase [Clostridia bacterium]